MKIWRLFLSLCAAALAVSACESFVQTTSGAEYIARANAAGASLSEELKAAASAEPILALPARIGVARIENGRLTDIPEAELAAWEGAMIDASRKGNEFIPVSLFITELAAPYDDFSPIAPAADRNSVRRNIIQRLQLGGARQHLDAIFVYEVFGRTSARQSALAIADLTILGGYLTPGRKLEATGFASALLFDVRNGYPYAAASASAERGARSPAFYASARARDILAASQLEAVEKLTADAARLFETLETELARAHAP